MGGPSGNAVPGMSTRLPIIASVVIVVALAFPGLAFGSSSGRLVLTASGLPSGEHAAVILHRNGIRRVIKIGHKRAMKLPGGRYSLAVKRVMIGRTHRGVQRGAIAYPAKKKVSITIKPNSATKVVVRYSGVVNKGVRRLPNRILGFRGSRSNPKAVILPLSAGIPRRGTIFVSAPTRALPHGLISKVTGVRKRGGKALVLLRAVPVSAAVPNLDFVGNLSLSPAEGATNETTASSASVSRYRPSVGPEAWQSSGCQPPKLVKFGAHLDSVELRQASLGAWPPQMRMTLAIRTTESLGVAAIAVGINCDWTLAELGPYQGAIPVGPIVIPVYATVPVKAGVHVNGRLNVGTVNVASTTVATAAAGAQENRASLSQQGSNVWTSGALSLSGSAKLGASAGLQAGIGIAKGANVHLEADFGPEFDWSSGHDCELRLNLGSLSAGVTIIGKTFSTPSFTPLHPRIWSGCYSAGGGGGGSGPGGGGGGGGGSGPPGGEGPGVGEEEPIGREPPLEPGGEYVPLEHEEEEPFSFGTGASAIAWEAPESVDHLLYPQFGIGNDILTVSCPSASLCVAGDNAGDILVKTQPQGTWTVSLVDPHPDARNQPCPSGALFCGFNCKGSVCTGAGNRTGIDSVSCPTVSFCAAVDTEGYVLTSTNPSDPGSWTIQPVDTGGYMTAISCASAELCVAGDARGRIIVSTDPTGDAEKWHAMRPAGSSMWTDEMSAISCPTPGFCAVIDEHWDAFDAWDTRILIATNPTAGPEAWRPFKLWTSNTSESRYITGFSCTSPELCVAVDTLARASISRNLTSSSPTWTTAWVNEVPYPYLPNPLVGLACTAAEICVAGTIDESGDIWSTTTPGNTWNRADFADPYFTALASIGCAPSSLCVAADGNGDIMTSQQPSTSWSAAHVDPQKSFIGESCPTQMTCMLTDEQDNFLITNEADSPSAHWSAQGPILGRISVPGGLSCPSESVCYSINGSNRVAVSENVSTSGTTWKASEAEIAGARLITCPTTSVCLVVSGDGVLYSSSDPSGGSAAWNSEAQLGDIRSISCPSSTFCAIANQEGEVLTTSDPLGGVSAWGHSFTEPDKEGRKSPLGSLSCSSESFCVAANEEGEVFWSTSPSIGTSSWQGAWIDNAELSVSCASSSFCVAVDSRGRFLSSSAPTQGLNGWSGPEFVDPGGGVENVVCPSEEFCLAVDGDGRVVRGLS